MEISQAEIRSLTDVLLQKYGLDFSGYEPKSFNRRVNRVMHIFKCESVHELWTKMLMDKALIHVFMDELSVGLTSMFRDPMMWSALRAIINDIEDKKLSIWNAGCSTGEEVYTLSIVLKEMGILSDAKILATDMNQTALKTAAEGRYHKIKMMDYEKNYREYNKFGNFQNYFSSRDSNYINMDRSLIQFAQFRYHNLITDQFFGSYDFIFCRNVMIYFDHNAKNILIEKFYKHLKPGGYFITGFYDSILPKEIRGNFNVDKSQYRIFQKPLN